MPRQVFTGILALSLSVVGFPYLFSNGISLAETGNATTEVSERKDQEFWVAEVVRLALVIRKAEEDYESFSRECKTAGESIPVPVCEQARESLAVSERARHKYQTLLDQASNASIPVAWLRAHFTWVRWSPEWQRPQHQEVP